MYVKLRAVVKTDRLVVEAAQPDRVYYLAIPLIGGLILISLTRLRVDDRMIVFVMIIAAIAILGVVLLSEYISYSARADGPFLDITNRRDGHEVRVRARVINLTRISGVVLSSQQVEDPLMTGHLLLSVRLLLQTDDGDVEVVSIAEHPQKRRVPKLAQVISEFLSVPIIVESGAVGSDPVSNGRR